ncbi:sulfatase [Alkalilimnicola sp. S0819]|uniref:sulfatase family protein n=1 Tax=Alkalilimnicola sp. S0819 TaxID=2613922 RepID=UPI00126187CF|nr:sulfatase-like hydrolase/transferase [Alkalilimnicola sp. S0819]KAB7623321.1 sulfatase-like hydrolase/transferase [Alkalilimnicola sp. S0819]MPQ16859.1 sulfatase-like hydrolase/transferase [Alkalilimnicola sp. S0819]
MSAQPNFILFMTDQQRADHLGCYGNTVLRTPHIDSLAASGTRYNRSYVTNPVCMPNRSSLMTGRMPTAHGVRANGIPLPTNRRTFVEQLAAAGYRTGLTGKAHLQNMTEVPPGRRPGTAALADAERWDFEQEPYLNEALRLWRDQPTHRVQTPYYGFEHVRLCTDHGDEVGGDYARWLASEHPEWATRRGQAQAIPDPRINTPQAWRTPLPETLYPSHWVADEAIAFVEGWREDARPFFLQCSFPDPHHPFTPPGKYWDMYDPADIDTPASFGLGDSPVLRHLREELAQDGRFRFGPLHRPFAVTAREAREAIALTYGSISMIDDQIGRVLAALKQQELDDNTVLIFMSDHGDYMGDHGLMLKGPMHYQGLIRTPLIWHDPQRPVAAQCIEAPVSSIDITASILARAGVEAYRGLQGRALPGLGQAGLPRDSVLIEDDRERIAPGFDDFQRVRTLVTERYRLSLTRPAGISELFDLQEDPHETVNRWDDPAYDNTRKQLTEQLLESLIEHQSWSPASVRAG